MQPLKKLIFRILVNRLTGNIICWFFPDLVPSLRWSHYRFHIKRSGVNPSLAASIFFGFYEAGELRFIHKYFNGDSDIVELGGSMGIVTSHLASRQKAGRQIISVEANPFLAETLTSNVNRYRNPINKFTLLTKAIAYRSTEVALRITDNSTETKAELVSSEPKDNEVIVPSIKLADIVSQFNLNDFTLVCDIEGAEIELLENDDLALKSCKELFIELHETSNGMKEFSIEDLKRLIMERHQLKLVDQHGPVLYFIRP